MRTASSRPAVFVVAIATLMACARPATLPGDVPAPAPAQSGTEAAEHARALARADVLRDRILAASSWTELGTRCNPGVLRTFADTTAAGQGSMTAAIEDLERTIIFHGIDEPVNTPAAHDLLRTVAGWEAGLVRPKWDVRRGETPREAIATGLAGEFENPATGRCEAYTEREKVVIVTPELVNFVPPRLDTARIAVFVGEAGLRRARDEFWSTRGSGDPIFTYTKIRVFVPWRDYAVVTVNRPAENRGVSALPHGAGGATYIFHRSDGEWKLLVIARTWG